MELRADAQSIFIAAVIVVALLLVCLRRRRRKRVVVAEGAGGEGVKESDAADGIVREEFTATTAKAVNAGHPGMVRHNSMFQMFKTSDVHEISEKLTNLDDVSGAIRRAGLESCNLIFGIDYTGSNYMQGKKTFGGKCLHHIDSAEMNPYQQVMCILGETLEPFDDDGNIPAYGFGDTYTRDHSVFSLNAMGPCRGFQDVLRVYNDITPKVRLGGPTNFAPLIRQAIEIVKKARSFHILVIVADGQVTAERDTTQAIVDASSFPLSIIMVGVGDGPWETMKDFDTKLPARRFNNFQFVNFSAVTREARNPQSAFALQALSDIPDQYKALVRLGIMDFEQPL